MPMMQDKQEKLASLIKLQDLKLFTARASKVKLVNLFDFGVNRSEADGDHFDPAARSPRRDEHQRKPGPFFSRRARKKNKLDKLLLLFFLFAAKSDFPFTLDRKKLFERDREEEDLIKRLPIEIESREGDTMISCRDDQLSRDKRFQLLFPSSRTNFSHQGW